jgi:pimeloyl-ACP methyl ester carboxylesterase
MSSDREATTSERPSRAFRIRAGARIAAALLVAVGPPQAIAQEPSTPGSPAPPPPARPPLAAAVEAYLAIVADAEAADALDALLARDDVSGDALHAIVTARPPTLLQSRRLSLPHAGDDLVVDIRVPADRADGETLPVLFVVNWSSPPLDDAIRDRVIVAEVPGYTPPQFSDVGRDGHMKIIRAVAHAAGGDPDSLWFTGYSWGGHASWDAALHRPGVLRGFIGRGGGPLRQWFRLFPNLSGVRALAVCGARDDPELVFNLGEVRPRATVAGFHYTYWQAADHGHDQPLPGEHEAGTELLATAPFDRATAAPDRGRLCADGAFVEHPLLRVLDVDPRRVALPSRVRVPPTATPGDQRRAMIDAMGAVATVDWRITTQGDTKTLTLSQKGVRSVQVFLRAPWFAPGQAVVVKAGRKTVFDGRLDPEPRALLEEVRRTGERQRPALRRVDVKF